MFVKNINKDSKRLFLIFSLVLCSSLVFSQNEILPKELAIDSSEFLNEHRNVVFIEKNETDTVKDDESLEFTVVYSAKDSIVPYFQEGIVNLYGDASLEYGDIKITAYHIVINKKENQVYAYQMPDTSKVIGAPNFVQGSENFVAKSIKYNFKTKKGFITKVYTKQDEGFLHGKISKKHKNGEIHMIDGKFTTCPYSNCPHFHMQLSKAIVVPNDKIITGPAYLVVAGTPMPFWIPFGIFPSTSESSQGVLFPSFGQDQRKGLYLKDLGYYIPFSDYADLAVRGSFYSRGSRDFEITSRFQKKYKFSGDFNLKIVKAIKGTIGSIDFSETSNFNLRFNWRQDPKSDPTSNFAASVNFMTSSFNKYDIEGSYDPSKYLKADYSSSISYSKKWEYVTLSTSLNASQNVKTEQINLMLPRFSLNFKDFYIFKPKKSASKPKWYEKLKTRLSIKGSNKIARKEEVLFNDTKLSDFTKGLSYSLPFGSSKSFLKFFNFNYSFNLNGAVMTKKIKKKWYPQESGDFARDILVTDTINGFYHAYNVGPSLGLSFKPKVYFMYNFIKGMKINAIRHVMSPTVSISLTPNIGLNDKAYYQTVQTSRRGDIDEYEIYGQGLNIYNAPSRGGDAQGSVSFSLNNTLEMKLNDGYDKDGELKTKKIVLLKSFSIGSSYNLYKDSLNLNNFNLSARTSLMGTSVNFGAMFIPYARDTLGHIYNKFEIDENGVLLRPSSANLSFSLNFDNKKMIDFYDSMHNLFTGEDAVDEDENKKNSSKSVDNDFLSGGIKEVSKSTKGTKQKSAFDKFKMPWNLSFSYSMRYMNPYIIKEKRYKSEFKHYLSFNGKLTLTKNTNFTFRADYDFEVMEVSNFNVSISREMHCWQSSFSWVPFGDYRSFNFRIAIKSSMLADTFKYEADRRYSNKF